MRIFISGVSGQFKACRDQVASDLRAVGAEVAVQEDFQQHGRTPLEKLENYIAGSDRVIALVGDAYGFEPEPDARPYDTPRRSYTQWEYFFAQGERLDGKPQPPKDVFVYMASANFVASNPVTQSGEEAGLQKNFVDEIRRSGKDRNPFGTLDELCRLILRDGIRMAARRRPAQNLPYPSLGTLFKGREDLLRELWRSLNPTSTAPATRTVFKALYGLGGVGKTRLAVEHAWHHEQDYAALLFVAADSATNLRRNLAALAGTGVFNLPQKDLPEEEARKDAALAWLDQHDRWLVILDNVDTAEAAAAVEETLARLRGGHVLITTRLAEWSGAVDAEELFELEPAQAAAFLLERTEARRKKLPTDAADAARLARQLDGLALALEQAGANIFSRRISLAQYLAEWEAHSPSVQEWHDPRLMKYPRRLAVTWETTLAQLGAREIALLRIFAHFAPDPIPLFVLEGEKAEGVFQQAVSLVRQEKTAGPAGGSRDALATLANYSMVRWDNQQDLATVHRVVQEIVRSRLPAAEKREWLMAALQLLNLARPGNPTDVRTWPRWNLLRPHVALAVTQADQTEIIAPTSGLMNELGLLFETKALYAEAEPLQRRALAIDEKSYGPEHPNVARRLNNLAQLLQDTNRLGEAEPLQRRALAIDEKSYGPEHPDVAIDLNNLAQLLKATNRLGEAEPLQRRALAIDEKSYGLEHPRVATDLNNLAQLLKATNRLAEAEPLMRRALAIDEKSYGPEHPDVAIDLNNLAQLLQDTNRLGDAEPLMRRALAIDEKNYGPEHPRVATELNNLAQLLQDTNRLDKAEPLMRRALAIDEKSYGPEHPKVAIRLNNLAQWLKDTNRLGEAEPLMRRALLILLNFTRNTGHEHPRLRAALENYAILLRAMGLPEEEVQARLQSLP